MRKDRDIFSLKENLLSCGIEFKKFFRDNRLKVSIDNQEFCVIGRIGMYHAAVDITGAEEIHLKSKVTIDIPPMQVNSMIRREYI